MVPPGVWGYQTGTPGHRVIGTGGVVVVENSSAWVENGPYVINYLPMGLRHVKVESVGVLTFEVPQEGLAESRCFHHSTDGLTFEEGVKLCDGSVQGLGGRTALEFKVHLLGVRCAIGWGTDQCSEFLGVKCGVLY